MMQRNAKHWHRLLSVESQSLGVFKKGVDVVLEDMVQW